MGKGRIILILGLVVGIGLFGIWRWTYKAKSEVAITPPAGSTRKDVENIFGKPIFSHSQPDKELLPKFSVVTLSIYNIHKNLCLNIVYSDDKVLKSSVVLGAFRPINKNNAILDNLNEFKQDVEDRIALQKLLNEATPMYIKAVKKLRQNQPVVISQEVLLEFSVIKKGRGNIPYWESAVYVDEDLKVYDGTKELGMSFYDYLNGQKSFADIDLFVDKNVPFDQEIMDLIKKKKLIVNFGGYNPDFQSFESHNFYSSSEVNLPGVQKLPVLNFQINGYKYKLEEEEFNLVNIERFFDRPEYKKGQFRVSVEVSKGSTCQQVFHFFNAVPKNMYAHVKL